MENSLIKGRCKHWSEVGFPKPYTKYAAFPEHSCLFQGGHIPHPKSVSQQFLYQAVSIRPFLVENQTPFCLSCVPVNHPQLILTLACLQDYFVESLFLVVISESLKMKTLQSA